MPRHAPTGLRRFPGRPVIGAPVPTPVGPAGPAVAAGTGRRLAVTRLTILARTGCQRGSGGPRAAGHTGRQAATLPPAIGRTGRRPGFAGQARDNHLAVRVPQRLDQRTLAGCLGERMPSRCPCRRMLPGRV